MNENGWNILALKEYLPICDDDFILVTKCPKCKNVTFSITNTYDYCPYCGTKIADDEYRRYNKNDNK